MDLAQAILFVDDIAKMHAFYTEHFGLEVKDGSADDGFVRLAPKGKSGAVLALHKAPKRKDAPAKRKGAAPAREDTAIKLCFGAKDAAALEAARASLEAAGTRMRKVHAFESITFCDGIDPEGNVFQLTTRR